MRYDVKVVNAGGQVASLALDARDVPFRSRTYQPLLGEPALRVRLQLYGDLHEDYAGQDVPDP
jgi:hypothetical protein